MALLDRMELNALKMDKNEQNEISISVEFLPFLLHIFEAFFKF